MAVSIVAGMAVFSGVLCCLTLLADRYLAKERKATKKANRFNYTLS